jgi:peptide/nickel transport system permease protein
MDITEKSESRGGTFMRKVWKQPLFLIGFLFIAGMLMTSFAYSWITDNEIKKVYYLYEDGRLVDGAPIEPRPGLPFGTDALGLDIFAKIIIGAKFTILAALAVAALRVFIALPFGFLVGTYFRKQKKYFNGLIDSFHYVPLTIIAYYLLRPVLMEPMEGFQTSMIERVIMEVLILALLTVPIIISLIGNESSLIYQRDFVVCAKSLGASNWRIIRKHIYPSLREKLFVIFGQQVMQTLIILSHLGLLKLFLGGTHVTFGIMPDPPTSITQEWSGLIGDSFRYLRSAPWIPLTPILCFAATMLAVALMIEGYVRATTGRSHYLKKPIRTKARKEKPKTKQIIPEDLQWFKQS